MVIDIMTWAILGVSAIGMIVMIIRKFPVLATIDLSRMTREHHARVKTLLTEERLRRKMANANQRFTGWFQPLFHGLGGGFGKAYDQLVKWERYYREKAESTASGSVMLSQNKNTVIDLLGKATSLVEDGNYMEAEKKYIDVISIDPRNFEAYKGLGEVYLQQQDYVHARASLSHALKIKPDEPEVHADVAVAFKELGRVNLALKSIEKAIELGGNNPKYLDVQTDLAIVAGDKYLAEKSLVVLREVNPENQKINEFEERVLQMKIKGKS